MHLTFAKYTAFGGTITDEDLLERLEFRARSRLDRMTLGRIKGLTTVSEAIKRCMFDLIGVIEQAAMNREQ